MKRLLMIVVLLFACFCNPCFATEYAGHWYPKYLHDDENYIYCDSHMGTAWYVDRNSIEVEQETDNDCILSVTVISVTYNDHQNNQPFGVEDIRKIDSKQYTFLYDFDEGKMYYASDWGGDRFVFIERYDTTWRYIKHSACWADVGIIKYAAIEAYRSIYGTGFYEFN